MEESSRYEDEGVGYDTGGVDECGDEEKGKGGTYGSVLLVAAVGSCMRKCY
jgi:hypothetical protein